MRQRVDSELGKAVLRVLKLDVAEEQLGVRRRRWVFIVLDERRSDESELAAELLEMELMLVVELCGVEEDENPVGPWGFDGGQKSRE